MLAKILSGAVVGLEAVPITVEVDISSRSLPSFTVVGLPDKAVEESRERVRAALKNTGADFPDHRILVNLAPADLPKAGPSYDLPIAIGMLVASGQLPEVPPDSMFVGELSLDGSLRHTDGILPVAVMAARPKSARHLFVPEADAVEAAVVRGIRVYPVPSLLALIRHFLGGAPIPELPPVSFSSLETPRGFAFDMSDIAGQEQAKRALEIAAAGSHNVFLKGPPGAGKTMLARSLPSILPDMTEEEAIEVTKIYSVTGNLPSGTSVITYRPFRSPHHTTSRNGLIGGGTKPAPGEISLAHRGVLFMDELPEYPRSVLEALRQPMEDGFVTISRALGTVRYPSEFTLVAAANPCPCGNFRSSVKPCTCMPGMIARYQKRISGPIIDRIDLHVDVPPVPQADLLSASERAESSDIIKRRVQAARLRQRARFRGTAIVSNAEMNTRLVRELCPLAPETLGFLRAAADKFGLSARGFFRVIKVSRTIADLDGAAHIDVPHIAEALQYRPKETL